MPDNITVSDLISNICYLFTTYYLCNLVFSMLCYWFQVFMTNANCMISTRNLEFPFLWQVLSSNCCFLYLTQVSIRKETLLKNTIFDKIEYSTFGKCTFFFLLCKKKKNSNWLNSVTDFKLCQIRFTYLRSTLYIQEVLTDRIGYI